MLLRSPLTDVDSETTERLPNTPKVTQQSRSTTEILCQAVCFLTCSCNTYAGLPSYNRQLPPSQFPAYFRGKYLQEESRVAQDGSSLSCMTTVTGVGAPCSRPAHRHREGIERIAFFPVATHNCLI